MKSTSSKKVYILK